MRTEEIIDSLLSKSYVFVYYERDLQHPNNQKLSAI